MVCITIKGLRISLDFTVPALGALLCMTMPLSEVLFLLTACVLHESAHFIAMWHFGCKPSMLSISATGMQLCAENLSVYPLFTQTVILLSGAVMNLLAAVLLFLSSAHSAALWNIAAAVFNLLPYRAADGGTLLFLRLEERLGTAYGDRIETIWRGLVLLFTAILAAILMILSVQNLSLWCTLFILLASEFLR